MFIICQCGNEFFLQTHSTLIHFFIYVQLYNALPERSISLQAPWFAILAVRVSGNCPLLS